MALLAALVPQWLWHPLGVCPSGAQAVGCKSYNFWSGIGSDFAYIAMALSAFIAAWRVYRKMRPRLECHEETCHRLGLHPVGGTHYRTCWEHHPILGKHPPGKVPLDQIHAAHRNAQRSR